MIIALKKKPFKTTFSYNLENFGIDQFKSCYWAIPLNTMGRVAYPFHKPAYCIPFSRTGLLKKKNFNNPTMQVMAGSFI